MPKTMVEEAEMAALDKLEVRVFRCNFDEYLDNKYIFIHIVGERCGVNHVINQISFMSGTF